MIVAINRSGTAMEKQLRKHSDTVKKQNSIIESQKELLEQETSISSKQSEAIEQNNNTISCQSEAIETLKMTMETQAETIKSQAGEIARLTEETTQQDEVIKDLNIQLEVYKLRVLGMSTAEIAEKLYIPEEKVKKIVE